MNNGLPFVFRSMTRKITGLIILSVLVFLLFGLVLVYEKKQQEATNLLVEKTNQTIYQLNTIRYWVVESESVSRGFLLTNDAAWLKELKPVYEKLSALVEELRKNSGDSIEQKLNLQKLKELVEKKILFQKGFTQRITATQRNTDAINKKGEGPQITREIKKLLNEMLAMEDRFLLHRISEYRKTDEKYASFAILFATIAFLIVLLLLNELNRDLLKRKKAEEELIAGESKYRSLIENAGALMFTSDLAGNILFANQQTIAVTGFSQEELIGKPYSIFLEGAIRAKIEQFYRDQFNEKRRTANCELSILTKGGEQKILEQSSVLLFEGNKPIGFQFLSRDITAKRKTEEALRKSENARLENEIRLKAILNNSTSLIYIKDLEGRYVMVNKKFKDFFGLAEETVIDKTDYDLTTKEIADRFKKQDDELYISQHPIQKEEQVSTPLGNRIVLYNKYPLYNQEQALLGICVIANDITDSIATKQQHVHAIKTAETARQIQEQFLANMSHEIRTPMNGIQGMTKLLLETNLNEEQKGFTNMINRALNNLVVIVNNVLDYSNLKTGKLVLDNVAFNLADLLEEIKKQFAHQVANKNLQFSIDIQNDVPEILKGDTYRLKQILANLVGNAVKFTQKGCVHLEIRVASQTDRKTNLAFTLTDTGVGIPEDKLQTIFESFAQANKEISRGYGGAGLGLSISKGLIEMQGGNISVTNAPGGGSIFTFTIPFDIKQINDNLTSEQETLNRLKGKRILVVEDNLVNQRLISFVLLKAGCLVDLANNGKEAVDFFEQKKPCDLVIMDLQMPVMDGYEAATYIRRTLTSTTPIIAMTATALKEDQERSYEVGMNDFIIKPFDFNDLYKRLVHVLYNEAGPAPIKEAVVLPQQDKLYDLSILEELGDTDSILDVLSLFFTNIPQDVRELEKLYEEKQVIPFSKLAHKIKGAVSMIQSAKLAQLLKILELKAVELNDVSGLADTLKEALELFTFLENQLKEERDRIMEQHKTNG
jgi:PAS domain S-box-containing protein